MAPLHFWFEFASTYSYPAAWRVEAEARARGVLIRWEPFLLGPIFAAQGWNDSPFNINPVKGRYMWRDLERVCAWVPEFVRAVYRANFAEDREISAQEVVGELLTSQGVRAQEWLERAGLPETKQRVREQTERAIAHGIFGAPSFTVRDELFWGSDRLTQALDLASRTP